MTNEEWYDQLGMQIELGINYFECQQCIFCSQISLCGDMCFPSNVSCRKKVLRKKNSCKLFKKRTFELCQYYPITIGVDKAKF